MFGQQFKQCITKESLLTFFGFVFYTSFSFAESRVLVEPLNFGRIVIADNSAVSEITITQSGYITNTNKIFILEPGNPGEIHFYDYPHYYQLDVSVNIVTPYTYQSGMVTTTEQFELVNIDTANRISVDGTGFARLLIGGTLRSTGNSLPYQSIAYQAIYEIDVSY
ncbi:DUF4402 domain-containing protein [Catenovulum sp. SM1970]|uniref:DUF4402 domain-containing protein n=1 Tax=Marinifaba aquimaris TaxID=2741323 RepID=UPI0015729E22|nr:DUF4402 domain-containing protein [Marinifaba aquimaris]NTS75668.1 DUF4402 domain-containing protein [Marinifaba aquimaris]